MIAPIQNVTIRGAIWYQGESNKGQDSLYTCRFNRMMAQWRRQWHVGTLGQTRANFPIGVVQIGPDTGTDASVYAIRQGQTADYGYMPNPSQPNTFMAAAFDLPNPPGTKCFSGCVHIFNKREVGRRLAAAGLYHVYNQTHILPAGPLVSNVASRLGAAPASTLSSAAAAEAPPVPPTPTQQQSSVTITYTGGNIVVRPPGLGFELLVNKEWLPANVSAHTANSVTLISSGGGSDSSSSSSSSTTGTTASTVFAAPSAVRYAFADKPCPNMACAIYGPTGLPSTPFVRNITTTGRTA